MNKNGIVAVVVVIAAVLLVGLWVMRSGQQRAGARQFDCVAPPAAPSALVAAKNGDVVTLNWTPPPGEEQPTTYVVEAGAQPGGNEATFVTPGNQPTFQRQAPASTYYVRVLARNACGTSGPSNEVTVVIP
jgi:hypothetical protein